MEIKGAKMTFDVKTTAEHWSDHVARFSGRNSGLFWWEAGPEIYKHRNIKISGSPDIDWVAYTLNKYYYNNLPFEKCLSLGCGSGSLERRLARLNAFQYCDAYDVAEGSLNVARELAKKEGIINISYFIADINKITLPVGMYDSVWISMAMHHFEALEHVCQQIKRSLKPEGLLILNEYVGPSRFQFSNRQKEVSNLCLQLLPARYRIIIEEQIVDDIERSFLRKGIKWYISRLIAKARDGDLIGVAHRKINAYRARASNQNAEKSTIIFPSRHDVIAADPSEAIRSEEIIDVIERDFEIIERKDWGGNVLQFLLAGIAGNFSAEDSFSQSLIKMLINIEDTLLECGEFDSDFSYIVARQRLHAN
jgi:ubiquinone/menaquinone biosynthesis C-methylase UbiE